MDAGLLFFNFWVVRLAEQLFFTVLYLMDCRVYEQF